MVQLINEYLERKLKEDKNYIVCSYYELRVNLNLSEIEMKEFLSIIKNKLENTGYEIYEVGEDFTYKNITRKVKENEQLIAIIRSEE